MSIAWWRRIPHPKYGNYGGLGRDICPVDEMDWAFWYHDFDSYKADKLLELELVSKAEHKMLKRKADHNLGVRLRGKLTYANEITGRSYNRLGRLIFRPSKRWSGILPIAEDRPQWTNLWKKKRLGSLEKIVRGL